MKIYSREELERVEGRERERERERARELEHTLHRQGTQQRAQAMTSMLIIIR